MSICMSSEKKTSECCNGRMLAAWSITSRSRPVGRLKCLDEVGTQFHREGCVGGGHAVRGEVERADRDADALTLEFGQPVNRFCVAIEDPHRRIADTAERKEIGRLFGVRRTAKRACSVDTGFRIAEQLEMGWARVGGDAVVQLHVLAREAHAITLSDRAEGAVLNAGRDGDLVRQCRDEIPEREPDRGDDACNCGKSAQDQAPRRTPIERSPQKRAKHRHLAKSRLRTSRPSARFALAEASG